ncbi:MAG: NAD(P)/FAD-dependent oxidoreductase [Acidobacteriaceae bacterium]
METADIVIAGAGVLGLACALELRRRGARVVVVERGQPMQEASWAAAGMLAAYDPENPSALLALAAHSQALYDGFLRSVEALSGISVAYRTQETLQQLSDALPLPTSTQYRQLTPAQAERRLPGLSSGGHRFLLLPERSLDPRDLCLAMPLAARAAGIEIRTGAAVRSVSHTGSGVRVEMDDGQIEAGFYLNCMGAWAGTLQGDAADAGTAIAPRKGQMAVVRLPQGAGLPSVIRSRQVYLVPRGDGRVVVGATVEEAGFDKRIVPEAVDALLTPAAVLWPALRQAVIVDRWAGLRPGTADDLPLIGVWGTGVSAEETLGAPARCFIAAGHFRNGILLAPATADVVGSLIAGEPPQVALEAFAPDRGRTRRSCDKHFTAAL